MHIHHWTNAGIVAINFVIDSYLAINSIRPACRIQTLEGDNKRGWLRKYLLFLVPASTGTFKLPSFLFSI